MPYSPETHDTLALDFHAAPYVIESWQNISLVFSVDNNYVPPLPWKIPTLVVGLGINYGEGLATQSDTRLVFERSIAKDNGHSLAFEKSTQGDTSQLSPWGESQAIDQQNHANWEAANNSQSVTSSKFQQALPDDARRFMRWGNAQNVDRFDYQVPFIVNSQYIDRFHSTAYFHTDLTGSVYDDTAEQRRQLNTDESAMLLTLAAFDEPYTPQPWNDVALSFGWVKPSRPSVPHDTTTTLTARQATPRDSHWRLPWGAGESRWRNWNLPYPVEENEQPPTEPTDPPEIKDVYLIMNTLDIRDIETDTPLDVANVRISLDIDSLAWKFSADLFGEGSLALVQPNRGGMKDISVTINGHRWVFFIDRYTSDERFPTKKFKIAGNSRTQYMAAPFAPTSTNTNLSNTTAAQAANAQLQNTGFTLTWSIGGDQDLPSWQIPAGALKYQDKTPAQVVGQIVTAAGGVLIPSMDNDSWKIQPRYRTAPWHWASATPDVAVYAGMVRSRSGKYEPGQEFNAVFVSGIEQGVSVEVQRQGSGGTNPMPDIYDDLITEAQPAISRGRTELGASGNKVIETISVIIPESKAVPGIIQPGQILKVTHDVASTDYLGLVIANSITVAQAGGAAVYQNVTIERAA